MAFSVSDEANIAEDYDSQNQLEAVLRHCYPELEFSQSFIPMVGAIYIVT